jgi:tetratricopeptide (TPR) repeat protein
MKKLWLLVLVLAGMFAVTQVVDAKAKAKKTKKSAKSKKDDDDKPKAPEYLNILVKGHDAYIVKNYDKALKLYKEAAEENSKRPKPHYFIGCAYRAMKDYDEAVDSFKTAFLMAGDDTWWKGLASFNIAVTHELAGDLKAAKSAWEDFKRFAEEKHLLSKFISTADSRIKAIDKYRALDEKYKAVRERIAKGEP